MTAPGNIWRTFPQPPSHITGPTRDYLVKIQQAIQSDQKTSGTTTVTSSLTLTEGYYRVRVKAASTLTLYLPDGQRYVDWQYQVKLLPESPAGFVVKPFGTQVIEGATSYSVRTAGWSLMLQSYGTGWDVI